MAAEVNSSMIDFFDDGDVSVDAKSAPPIPSEEELTEAQTVETTEEEAEQPLDDDTDADADDSDDEPIAAKPVPKAKAVTFTQGDNQYQIPKDAVVEVKVNGEKQQVSFEDLHQSYASRQANYSEYLRLKNYNQELAQKESAMESVVKDFASSVKEGKIFPALSKIIEATGENPIPLIREMRANLLSAAREYLSLDESQLKMLEIAEENEYYKMQAERLKKSKHEDATSREMEEGKQKVIKLFGFTEQNYNELLTELEDAKKAGTLKLDTITPAEVGRYAAYKVRTYHIHNTVKEIAPHLLGDKELLGKLDTVVREVSPNLDELKQFVRAYVGSGGDKGQGANGKQSRTFNPRNTKPSPNKKRDPGELFF